MLAFYARSIAIVVQHPSGGLLILAALSIVAAFGWYFFWAGLEKAVAKLAALLDAA